MSIQHKFQQRSFGNGFVTNNSILSTDQYDPEVIFIGTFNHGWGWNHADFFYGRGMYMWPVMANLFLHNSNHLITKSANIVTLPEIFKICTKGKIVFADIVKGIKQDIEIEENIQDQNVLVNNEYIWETYADKPIDYMASQGWIDDNVDSIVKYINNTMSIKHVYFTFKSGKWIVQKLNEIRERIRPDVSCCSIYTPTGQHLEELPEPFQHRTWGLAHCWIWNGQGHSVPVDKKGYGHLDHGWLDRNGVDPNNF